MFASFRKFLLLLFAAVCIFPALKAQLPLETALPPNTWLLQSAFEGRLPCSYAGEAEFGVPPDFLSAVVLAGEKGELKLYKDWRLSEAWDLDELRKKVMERYQMMVELMGDDFGDWASEMGPGPEGMSLEELVGDGMLPGTAGMVERLVVNSGKITWERKAAFLSWGGFENLDQALEVFWDADSDLIPWEKLIFQQNIAGFQEFGLQRSLDFHRYSFYPERVIAPGERDWQTLVYNPLPGTTPDMVFANMEAAAGGKVYQLLQRADGRKPDVEARTKGPYILSIPQQPGPWETLDGLLQPEGEWMNMEFLKEYVPQLMEMALQGKLDLYSVYGSGRKVDDPLQEYLDLEESVVDFDSGWGGDDWNSELSPEKRREKLAKMDYSVFDGAAKVIGRLEKGNRGGVFVPEFLEVTCFLPAVDDAPQPFARIKITDVATRFAGMSLEEFLLSSSCFVVPRKIAGESFESIAEGHYLGWLLENDWSRLPSQSELEKMRKGKEFSAKLEALLK